MLFRSRRNLYAHETACQRKVHEYGDQNVTKVLVYWNISFDEDDNHNNTLWVRCFEGKGNDRNPTLCHMPFNLQIVVVFPLVS